MQRRPAEFWGWGAVLAALLVSGSLVGAVRAQSSDAPVPSTYASPNAEDGGEFGASVVGVGDVDGDGAADVLVGAPGESVGGRSGAGRAYLFGGAEGEVLHTLTAPTPEKADRFGTSVAGVEDLSGDGTPDVVVTAAGPERAGRVHLYSGATGEALRTLTSPNATADGLFGQSVVGVGDVNGDGAADLFVGAIGEGEDRVYLFSGASGEVLYTLSSPTEGHDHFGHLAAVGDVDEDGVTDLLVGASTTTVEERGEAGRAYLYSGAGGERLQTLVSPAPKYGHFGYLVAAAGDVDRDGTPDAVVGAVSGPDDGGKIYVFGGDDGEVLRTMAPPAPQEDGHFGYSARAVADATGGGTPDLFLGTRVSVSGWEGGGRAYLYDGVKGRRIRTLRPPESSQGDRFGASIAGVRRSEGGAVALLVGAQGESVDGQEAAGRVYRFPAP